MLPVPVVQAAASTIAGTPVQIVCQDFTRVNTLSSRRS
jgi:hypothetical protein